MFNLACDELEMLIPHFIGLSDIVIFVVDSSEEARHVEALKYIMLALRTMEEKGINMMYIVFNKQDLLPDTTRNEAIKALRRNFDSRLKFAKSCVIKYTDALGFSALESSDIAALLDAIATMLKERSKSPPQFRTERSEMRWPTGPLGRRVIPPKGKEQTMRRIRWVHQCVSVVNSPHETLRGTYGAVYPEIWNHYSYLMAHLVLLDSLEGGKDVWAAARCFHKQLNETPSAQAEGYRNYTMVLFWLQHLHYTMEYEAGIPNRRILWTTTHKFHEFLRLRPELIDANLWQEYYTPEAMLATRGRNGFQIPDLKPLLCAEKSKAPLAPAFSRDHDPDRLVRFALKFVQWRMTNKEDSNAHMEEALQNLQSSVIKQRALNTSVPAYSVTQAFFWTQFVASALESFYPSSETGSAGEEKSSPSSTKTAGISAESMTVIAFKTFFSISGLEWRTFYTPGVWEDVRARCEFVNPDKQALPNPAEVQNCKPNSQQFMEPRIAWEKDLPRPAELSSLVKVLCIELNAMIESGFMPTRAGNLAELLFILHEQFWEEMKNITEEETSKPDWHKSAKSRALLKVIEDAEIFHEVLAKKLGGVAFWCQQLLLAMIQSGSHAESLVTVIRINPHLAYGDLPLLYCSPEQVKQFEVGLVDTVPARRLFQKAVQTFK